MKHLDFSRENYLSQSLSSLHTQKNQYTPSKSFDEFPNLIIYGSRGCGKYTQSLHILRDLSPTKLKYERKMVLNNQSKDKESLYFTLSDIHIEVDFDMLGCHSKALWHDIYTNYVDIVTSKKNKIGVILIKNFSSINNELHDIFYSYIQHYDRPYSCQIKYILLTEEVSFIYNNIMTHFTIFSIPRPSLAKYKGIVSNYDGKIKGEVNNIKNLILNVNDELPHKKLCDKLIAYMDDMENLKISQLRDHIYDLLVYNLNIYDCIWYINHHYSKKKKYKDNIVKIMAKTVSFFQLYNNNYRPIYHLENYFVYLITVIHGS